MEAPVHKENIENDIYFRIPGARVHFETEGNKHLSSIERIGGLTVVIPTLNSENYLGAALNSLQFLRNQGANVVVVDSHSADNTVEIAKTGSDSILLFPKGNMYGAINHGLRSAKTEWLAYLNSDDLVYPRTIYRELLAMADSCDLLYGNIDFVNEDGHFLHDYLMPPPSDILPLAGMRVNAVPPQGTLFRKRVFDTLGGFDTAFRLAADHDFFVRAALQGFRYGKVAHPPLAAFRLHGSQLSHTRQEEHIREAILIAEKATRSTSSLQRRVAYCTFKLRNIRSFLIRILRGHTIHGSYRMRGCMDIPTTS